VAGVIAAATDNAVGIAGFNWGTRILPCARSASAAAKSPTVADAIFWSAGIPVSGIPDNTNPADVINLSLTVATTGECDRHLQSAISFASGRTFPSSSPPATARLGEPVQPANLLGVIAVGAVLRNGACRVREHGKPGRGRGARRRCRRQHGGRADDVRHGTTAALNDNAYRAYLRHEHRRGARDRRREPHAVREPTLGPRTSRRSFATRAAHSRGLAGPCTPRSAATAS
jgi:hypothetical protein